MSLSLSTINHKVIIAGIALLGLQACVTSSYQTGVVDPSQSSNDGMLAVTVSAGQGRSCANNPCQIYFKTPDVGGNMTIVVNGFEAGSFPSNTTVNLGSYGETTNRIQIIGHDYPMTFINLPGNNN